MTPQRKSPPRMATGNGLEISGQRSVDHYNPLATASVSALEQELAIVLAAADRFARGYGLVWDDYDRLHEAHQHLIRVLAQLRGQEVLQ